MSSSTSGSVVVRPTPHALESEQVLLGAMFLHSEIVAQLRVLRLHPGHLWRADHQKILRTAFELDDRGVTPEALLIKEKLRGHLDGGPAYLLGLADYAVRLHANNIRVHVGRIHATWAARQQQTALENYSSDLSNDPWAALNGGPVRLAESLDKIRREVVPPSDDLEPLIDDLTLLKRENPEALVDGRIPAGGSVVLVGPPGAGKTFIGLDLALSVATGRRWLGADVGRSGPVVYIAADGASLKPRVRAWKRTHGYRDEDLLGLYIWPAAVNFLNPQDVDRFIQVIISLAPKLVIGDTLARCMPGGDENSAKDMGLLVEHTDQVRRRVLCTFAWVHHTNRAGTGERGSGALRGACDTLLSLSDRQVLTCDKQRDAERFGRLRLHLARFHGSCVVELAPDLGADSEMTATGDDLKDTVLHYVRQNPGLSTRSVASGVNRNRDHVAAALSDLHARHQVDLKPVGKANAWTSASRSA